MRIAILKYHTCDGMPRACSPHPYNVAVTACVEMQPTHGDPLPVHTSLTLNPKHPPTLQPQGKYALVHVLCNGRSTALLLIVDDPGWAVSLCVIVVVVAASHGVMLHSIA